MQSFKVKKKKKIFKSQVYWRNRERKLINATLLLCAFPFCPFLSSLKVDLISLSVVCLFLIFGEFCLSPYLREQVRTKTNFYGSLPLRLCQRQLKSPNTRTVILFFLFLVILNIPKARAREVALCTSCKSNLELLLYR